jgi:hypothetical protein
MATPEDDTSVSGRLWSTASHGMFITDTRGGCALLRPVNGAPLFLCDDHSAARVAAMTSLTEDAGFQEFSAH